MKRKYHLQEWFSVSSLSYVSSELALQAVLQALSERLKNASYQACLYDWFTPLLSVSRVFSVRFLAYPLRFVNLLDGEIVFSPFMFQHWYSLQLCIVSVSGVLFVSFVDAFFCREVDIFCGDSLIRQTLNAQSPSFSLQRPVFSFVCSLPEKDACHFFSFHLTRIKSHEVFCLSRWVPSQGALTDKKPRGKLSGQVENQNHLSRVEASFVPFCVFLLLFFLFSSDPVSISGRAKYITGCFSSFLLYLVV